MTTVNLSPETLRTFRDNAAASLKPFDDDTGMPTPGFVKYQEEVKADPKIERLQAAIAKEQAEYDALGSLRVEAEKVDKALNPFKWKHGLERDVIASTGLSGAVTASVNGGATIDTKDVTVLQTANKQIFEFTGLSALGAASHFTSNATDVVDIAGVPANGKFSAGNFTIIQNGNTATVTLTAGESLDTIAANIVTACAAAAPAAVTVTPTVVQFETGKYKLVLESDASGPTSSFVVDPGAANMFDNIKAATPEASTKVVHLYADSAKTGFDETLPASPPGSTAPVRNKIITINGIGVPVQYDSSLGTYAEFLQIAHQINAKSPETGVVATTVGGANDRHIELRRADGLTGISVNVYDPNEPFLNTPAQLYYEGEATNAIIEVDGVRYESADNSFANITGFTDITVKAKGSGTLSIVQGNPGLEAGARDLVVKYNASRDFIKTENAKVDEDGRHISSLYNSQEMRRLKTYLDNIMNHRNDAASTVKKWVDLGITFDSDKKMLLNETQFKAAFEDPAVASEIFDFFARTTAASTPASTTANNTIPAGAGAPAQGTLVASTSYFNNAAVPSDRQGTLSINAASTFTSSLQYVTIIFTGVNPTDPTHYTASYRDKIGGPPIALTVGPVTDNGVTYSFELDDGVQGLKLDYTTATVLTTGDEDKIYTSFIANGSVDPAKAGTVTVTNFGTTPANIENIEDVIIHHNSQTDRYEATIIRSNGSEYNLFEGGPIGTTVRETAVPANQAQPSDPDLNVTFSVTGGDLDGFVFTYVTDNVLSSYQNHIFKGVTFTQAGAGGGPFTSIASIDLDSYITNLDKAIARKFKFVTERKATNRKKIADEKAEVQRAFLKAQADLLKAKMMNVDRIADMLAGAASAA